MEAARPGNKTIWLKFHVESDVQVQNIQIFHPDQMF